MKFPISNFQFPTSYCGGQAPRFNSGQAVMIVVLFFLAISLAITFGFSSLAVQQERIVRTDISGKKSYFLSEAGQEDVIYRFKTARKVSSEEVIVLDGNTATTTIVSISSGEKEVTSVGSVIRSVRKLKTVLDTSDEVDFNFGVQVGDGGAVLENTSSVDGNLFSNGPVSGRNRNLIKGTVISASLAGLIDGVHATGTAYAHTIQDSLIETDAYYQIIRDTTVLGTLFPGSQDRATSILPISDEMIDKWKASAEAGGVITSPCPYEINRDATLGPVKINCDLEIKGNPVVTLEGMVWVLGDVTIKNSATVRITPSLPGKSLAIIADNPSNRITGSKVKIENTSTFEGSGGEGSFVLIISQNESAETGGDERAIEVSNQADAGDLLVYAAHGEILLKNNITLREVSAYRVRLQNTAEVVYESGLASLLFDSGPAGGLNILDWKEIE